MRSVLYALIPLAILLAAASLACFVGYFVVLGIGDQFPLRKVITKITLVFLVLSIFPAMKRLKLTKEDLGFAPKKIFLKQLVQGIGLGLLTLMPVFLILYALDINVVDQSKNWTFSFAAQKLIGSLALALLISLVEEPLFRGILLTGLARTLKLKSAIMTSAAYYAALHFVHSSTKIPFQDLNLFSGFPLMIEAFANIINPVNYSAFLSLLMVGIFLCLIRTNIKASLGLCIGCHAAWVWQIKMSKSVFDTNPHSDYLYLVSAYDGVIGMLVTGWLMLVVAAYWIHRRFSKIT
ncbi:MAG: CPBP family glutamic-type intramembrane protease [Gammaproteobacteria bacterium]